ncbi:MAG: hypothetical protein WC365_06800 [Candidatus Babeliales bacterium]|jgi:hypothetical protein
MQVKSVKDMSLTELLMEKNKIINDCVNNGKSIVKHSRYQDVINELFSRNFCKEPFINPDTFFAQYVKECPNEFE